VGDIEPFKAEYALTSFGKAQAGLRSHSADASDNNIERLSHGVVPAGGIGGLTAAEGAAAASAGAEKLGFCGSLGALATGGVSGGSGGRVQAVAMRISAFSGPSVIWASNGMKDSFVSL
jgi:hypothetical protein